MHVCINSTVVKAATEVASALETFRAVVTRTIDVWKGLVANASPSTGAADSVARIVFGSGFVMPVAVLLLPPSLLQIRFAGVEVVSRLDEI